MVKEIVMPRITIFTLVVIGFCLGSIFNTYMWVKPTQEITSECLIGWETSIHNHNQTLDKWNNCMLQSYENKIICDDLGDKFTECLSQYSKCYNENRQHSPGDGGGVAPGW